MGNPKKKLYFWDEKRWWNREEIERDGEQTEKEGEKRANQSRRHWQQQTANNFKWHKWSTDKHVIWNIVYFACVRIAYSEMYKSKRSPATFTVLPLPPPRVRVLSLILYCACCCCCCFLSHERIDKERNESWSHSNGKEQLIFGWA